MELWGPTGLDICMTFGLDVDAAVGRPFVNSDPFVIGNLLFLKSGVKA